MVELQFYTTLLVGFQVLLTAESTYMGHAHL